MKTGELVFDQKKVRFSDAPWFAIQPQDIILGGAGGIGSNLAHLLSRLGHSLCIYDFDLLEEHNLAKLKILLYL